VTKPLERLSGRCGALEVRYGKPLATRREWKEGAMRLANGEGLVTERGATRATGRAHAGSAQARARRETAISLLYLLPSLIVFGVFVFYPLFKSFYLSLFASDPFGLGSTPFVGLKQYQIALKSQSYRDGLGVTILYTLYTVPLGILIALALEAILESMQNKGVNMVYPPGV